MLLGSVKFLGGEDLESNLKLHWSRYTEHNEQFYIRSIAPHKILHQFLYENLDQPHILKMILNLL